MEEGELKGAHSVACSPCFAILACKQTAREDRLEIREATHSIF